MLVSLAFFNLHLSLKKGITRYEYSFICSLILAQRLFRN